MEFVIPTFFSVALIISLCIVVSVLHEKKKLLRQTVFYDPLWKTEFLKLVHTWIGTRHEVYAMICVNDTIQIDIRRFYSGKP